MDMVRYMFKVEYMPRELWEEVVATVVCQMKRCSTKIVHDKKLGEKENH